MKVVLLCAGYATRLYPLTENQPKALLPIQGKPILERILDKVSEVQGVDSVFVVTNRRFAEPFQKWSETLKYAWPVKVVDDGTTSNENRLGAVGDLQYVLKTEGVGREDVLVIAGDNLFNFDINAFVACGKKHRPYPVLAVYDVKDLEMAKRYGLVLSEKDGKVKAFLEKPQNPPTTMASCGIYWLPKETRELLDKYLAGGHNPDQPGHYMQWLSETSRLYSLNLEGLWFDIGDLESYKKANEVYGDQLKERKKIMSKNRNLFTSESVSEGHPDKLCDQISDAILDDFLRQDPKSRVACECLVTTGTVVVAGEITSNAYVDIPSITRGVIREIGYTDAAYGFDYKTCGILTAIQQQSPDIAMGVDTGGAGDQGMMFGYASDETAELMPTPIILAHQLLRKLSDIRKKGELGYLRPDAKSQVTVEYEGDVPSRIDAVVISTQHDPDATQEQIAKDLKKFVIPKVIPAKWLDSKTKIYINPTGRFEIGGPHGDTGLTGRKIIVDTYGGFGRHGGGAFSGKDPSKVDRSACYFARYAAKNVVASGAAKRCEIQVSYAIGVAEPVSVRVETFGTNVVSDDKIAAAVRKHFNFTPRGIISKLNLLRPIYKATAAYGHFGRNEPGFTWEKTDVAESLKKELGLSGKTAKKK